jgi:excisionase family DNA binding protein
VSRPFLVQLLEQKKLPFRLVGTHRRIRFEDVLRYKENIDAERRKVLDQLAAEAQELKMGY